MHYPISLCRSQEARLEGLLRTIAFAPGGAIGVALKLKFPCVHASAESFGLTLAVLSKLSAIISCGMSRSHSERGKLGSVAACPDLKWLLNVRIALSAMQFRCLHGATNW